MNKQEAFIVTSKKINYFFINIQIKIPHMKFPIFGFLLCLCVSLNAQDVSTTWVKNMEEAQSLATEKAQNILVVFAGSDWCRPCIKFKKDILENAVFDDYAKDNLVVLYLDFPARKKNRLPKAQRQHNEQLAEQYNPKGFFPHLVLLDANGQKISEPKFTEQTADDFVAQIMPQNTNAHE